MPVTESVDGSILESPVRTIELNKSNQWAVDKTLPEQHQDTASYNDIWKRISAGLALERHLDQPSVRSKLKWYSEHQGYLNRVADRAAPYIYHIVEELEARNMPLELALLPIVESAYQPLAYSRSHAAGIWQFIPATGDRFGLKQNWWYDGRRDITAATAAALDYLQFLHTELNGNWLHAVAGYNAGENKILRSIQRNSQAGHGTTFWDLSLPTETRGYVPALLAISELVANPERYGVKLKPIANQPYFTQVATDGQIDLGKAANLAGISEAEMKRLNPGFKRWATDPDGPHGLLIPLEHAESFKLALQELPASERISWRQHQIRRGETLSQIANRYGTNVAVLQRSNQLRGSLIRAGQRLLIPAPGRDSQPSAELTDSVRTQATSVAKQHTVRSGDTLWTIARRYNHRVADLTQLNDISARSVLQPGQQLNLPAQATTSADSGQKLVRYTVRQGDSLWTISRRFQVSVTALREWNSLNRKALLQPGQQLELYVAQEHGI